MLFPEVIHRPGGINTVPYTLDQKILVTPATIVGDVRALDIAGFDDEEMLQPSVAVDVALLRYGFFGIAQEAGTAVPLVCRFMGRSLVNANGTTNPITTALPWCVAETATNVLRSTAVTVSGQKVIARYRGSASISGAGSGQFDVNGMSGYGFNAVS